MKLAEVQSFFNFLLRWVSCTQVVKEFVAAPGVVHIPTLQSDVQYTGAELEGGAAGVVLPGVGTVGIPPLQKDVQ